MGLLTTTVLEIPPGGFRTEDEAFEWAMKWSDTSEDQKDEFRDYLRWRKGLLPCEPFDLVEPAAREWMVRGLLPATGLGFIVGPPGAGKSFLAIDLLARIASGRSVLDRPTRHMGAVYLAAEAPGGVRKRLKAWRQVHGGGAALYLIGRPVDLRDEDSLDYLDIALESIAEHFKEVGGPQLGLVAIDTLAAAMPGGDENDGADMSRVIGRLQKLSRDHGVLVLLVAHLGKDEGRGIRGWSGLTAAADLILTVRRDKADRDLRQVTLAKLKDGEDGARFGFRLAGVELGEDQEGEPVSSAVVAYEGVAEGGRQPRALNASEVLVLQAIHDLAAKPARTGQNVPPGQGAIARQALHAAVLAAGFAAATEKRNTINARFGRALNGLAAKGRAKLGGEWIWIL